MEWGTPREEHPLYAAYIGGSAKSVCARIDLQRGREMERALGQINISMPGKSVVRDATIIPRIPKACTEEATSSSYAIWDIGICDDRSKYNRRILNILLLF